MIIYYYCHFNIKNLGPIYSTIVDSISYCIIILDSYHTLPYNDIIYLFLCLFSLLIHLEIIELNCLGLNKNIKIEIEKSITLIKLSRLLIWKINFIGLKNLKN